MWDPYEGDMALRQIESKNIEWLTVEQLAEKYGPAAKRRMSHLARMQGRATQGNVAGATKATGKTTSRAFRMG
jgi:hypothetical protein